MQKVLCFDLGGTKLASALVDDRGEYSELRKTLAPIEGGPEELLVQMEEVYSDLLSRGFKIRSVGISSAGPLDPQAGILLDPTNFRFSNGKTWGVFPLVEALSKKIPVPIHMDNDAVAALLAENWIGAGKSCDNLVVMTLGTGVGVAALAGGKIVRAGRGLHPEVSHTPLFVKGEAPLCECGMKACMEAFLSANHFVAQLRTLWNEPSLTGENLVLRAKNKDPKALQAFDDYSEKMALALASLVVLFAPEKILIGGGFSSAFPHFASRAKIRLAKLIERRRKGIDLMPSVELCALGWEAGLVGAARLSLGSGQGLAKSKEQKKTT